MASPLDAPKHIRVWCGEEDYLLSYWHHGVLMPDWSVIHLTTVDSTGSFVSSRPRSDSSTSPSSFSSVRGQSPSTSHEHSGVVERVSLADFSGGNTVYKATYDSPLRPNESIRRAESKLGPYSYNLIFDNCESFARWCIIGIAFCDQILYPALVAGRSMLPGIPGMLCERALDNVRENRGTFSILETRE